MNSDNLDLFLVAWICFLIISTAMKIYSSYAHTINSAHNMRGLRFICLPIRRKLLPVCCGE